MKKIAILFLTLSAYSASASALDLNSFLKKNLHTFDDSVKTEHELNLRKNMFVSGGTIYNQRALNEKTSYRLSKMFKTSESRIKDLMRKKGLIFIDTTAPVKLAIQDENDNSKKVASKSNLSLNNPTNKPIENKRHSDEREPTGQSIFTRESGYRVESKPRY